MAIITLTTDFGTQDGFVGTMKGVILGINADASIVDITHEIPPQDIQHCAFVLRNSPAFFPPGTVHVAVVDPGVGTERPAIIVEAGEQLWVGPDNGVFAYIYHAYPDARATYITNTAYSLPQLSRTFHGRDVFAPVGAHLSMGVKPEDCGPELAAPVQGEIPAPLVTREYIHGHILHIDRFGNAVTNIPETEFLRTTGDQVFRIEFCDMYLDQVNDTYGDVDQGEVLAVIGSAGLLEISISGGNAAHTLGMTRFTPVNVVLE